MSTTVGIVGENRTAESIRKALLEPTGVAGPALEVMDVPPTSLVEFVARAEIILVVLPERETLEALECLRDALGQRDARPGSETTGGRTAGVIAVSASPLVSLAAMRRAVGPGPWLMRMVVVPLADPGEGLTVVCAEPGAFPDAVSRAVEALARLGRVEVLSEEALDAAAAVALGSAAFLCTALEGMEEGAARAGLPADTASAFVRQTALATGLLLRGHPGSPADLKDQVASPGGTTVAALGVLEDAAVRGSFIRAVEGSAAEVRARRDAGRPGVIE